MDKHNKASNPNKTITQTLWSVYKEKNPILEKKLYKSYNTNQSTNKNSFNT